MTPNHYSSCITRHSTSEWDWLPQSTPLLAGVNSCTFTNQSLLVLQFCPPHCHKLLLRQHMLHCLQWHEWLFKRWGHLSPFRTTSFFEYVRGGDHISNSLNLWPILARCRGPRDEADTTSVLTQLIKELKQPTNTGQRQQYKILTQAGGEAIILDERISKQSFVEQAEGKDALGK